MANIKTGPYRKNIKLFREFFPGVSEELCPVFQSRFDSSLGLIAKNNAQNLTSWRPKVTPEMIFEKIKKLSDDLEKLWGFVPDPQILSLGVFHLAGDLPALDLLEIQKNKRLSIENLKNYNELTFQMVKTIENTQRKTIFWNTVFAYDKFVVQSCKKFYPGSNVVGRAEVELFLLACKFCAEDVPEKLIDKEATRTPKPIGDIFCISPTFKKKFLARDYAYPWNHNSAETQAGLNPVVQAGLYVRALEDGLDRMSILSLATIYGII